MFAPFTSVDSQLVSRRAPIYNYSEYSKFLNYRRCNTRSNYHRAKLLLLLLMKKETCRKDFVQYNTVWSLSWIRLAWKWEIKRCKLLQWKIHENWGNIFVLKVYNVTEGKSFSGIGWKAKLYFIDKILRVFFWNCFERFTIQ